MMERMAQSGQLRTTLEERFRALHDAYRAEVSSKSWSEVWSGSGSCCCARSSGSSAPRWQRPWLGCWLGLATRTGCRTWASGSSIAMPATNCSPGSKVPPSRSTRMAAACRECSPGWMVRLQVCGSTEPLR